MAARRGNGPETSLEPLLAAKEIVICCGSGGVGKTTTAAAAAAMAAAHLGGKVLVLTVDPAAPPGQRPRARAVRQRRVAGAARAVRRGRRRAPRRAVGGHARHQAVVGRPRPLARPRRRHPRRHPRQPALPQHHRALRAEPRLHRHGAALRDPRVGPLRPDRGRHPADPERHRLPRGARPHGRLLLEPPAALADRAGAQPRVHDGVEALLHGGRPHPRVAVPAGHRRVLPAVPDDVRRVRRAGPRRRPARCPTSARRSSWSRRSRRRRSARPSSSSRRSPRRKFHLGAVVSTRCCRVGSSTGGRRTRPSASAATLDPWPRR